MKLTRKYKYILGISASLVTVAVFFTNASVSDETIQNLNSAIAGAAKLQHQIDTDNLSPEAIAYLKGVKTSLDNLISIHALAADCQQLLNLDKTLKSGFYNVYPSKNIYKLTHVHCNVQNNVATTDVLLDYDSSPSAVASLPATTPAKGSLLLPATDFVHNTGKAAGTAWSFETSDKGFVISNTNFASYLGAGLNIAEFVFSIKTLTEKAGSANIPLNVYIYDVTTSEYLFWVRITADQMISNEKVDKVTVQVPIDTTSRADHKINAAVVTNGGVSGSIDTVRVYPNSKNLIAPIILRNTEADNTPLTYKCKIPAGSTYTTCDIGSHIAGIKAIKPYDIACNFGSDYGLVLGSNSTIYVRNRGCDTFQIITTRPSASSVFAKRVDSGDSREYDTVATLTELGIPTNATAIDIKASCGQGQVFIASDTYEYAPNISISPRKYECGEHRMCNWPYPSFGWLVCSAGNNQTTSGQKTTVPLTISPDMLNKMKVRIRNYGGAGYFSVEVVGWRE